MKIEITITNARLFDIITSSKIDYWGDWAQSATRTKIKSMIADGKPVEIVDIEDGGKLWAFDSTDVQKALVLMAAKYPHKLAEVLDEDKSDMYTGDILIQLAVFGEEKYA